MLNSFFRASSDFARQKASQSAAWAVIARDTVSGFLTTAHHMLLVLGIIAIGAIGAMLVKPDIADRLVALSPFAGSPPVERSEASPQFVSLVHAPSQSAAPQPAALVSKPAPSLKESESGKAANSRQQEWVISWISKRYRVATDATNMFVSAAYATAREIQLDPLLILSVMAIESRFNPFAESPVGAQGLMQVMSRVHRDKFEDHGGVQAALDPIANIKVGSRILKEYVTRGGSVEAGLKLYVGAGLHDTDFGYGAKVLAEYGRLQQVAMGKKVPVFSTSAAAAPKPPQEIKVETPVKTTPTDSGEKVSDQMAAL